MNGIILLYCIKARLRVTQSWSGVAATLEWIILYFSTALQTVRRFIRIVANSVGILAGGSSITITILGHHHYSLAPGSARCPAHLYRAL